MAPEQLEGKPADARTDIFALGTLLFEMATGRKAFDGQSQASLIASILTEQPPPVSAAQPELDPGSPLVALDHVVERCLAKNPDERWQTARDITLELEWIQKGRQPSRVSASRGRRPHWREGLAWILAMAAVATIVGLVLTPRGAAPGEPTRFIVSAPPGTTIGVAENRTRIAIAPDGRHLAMIAFSEGRSQLWLRPLDSVAAVLVPGTEGAVSPFWSADSRFIGFFSPADGELKKVERTGGPVRTICRAQIDGAPVWGRDGTILFTEFPRGGIHRVAADGGTPVAVTSIDKGERELNHYWPQFLPDDRHFLYMATRLDANGLRATPKVYVASFDSPAVSLVAEMHSRMTFAQPDYLLFVEDGTLLAQRFDLTRLRFIGEPAPIADKLAYFRTLGNGSFSVSSNGVLAYQGTADPLALTWYDRRGTATDSGWPTQSFGSLRFSPDAQRIAVDVASPRIGTSDIWIYEVARGAPIRLTTDLTNESGPVWSPDGRRILFRWERGGSPNLYARTIGSGTEELLVSDPSPLSTEDWSRDGQWIVYVRNTRQTATDLWLRPTGGDEKPRPFAATRFEEWSARFSPDSRWVAFVSTESGSPEVYVSPVNASGDRTRISIGGGTTPRWRGDGRELFYASPDNRSIMSVSVTPSPRTFIAGVPSRLFSIGAAAARDRARSTAYDVSPDGRRFLISVPAGEPSASRVTVVLNWIAAMKKQPG
jgi:Tol biopolymer transport system component